MDLQIIVLGCAEGKKGVMRPIDLGTYVQADPEFFPGRFPYKKPSRGIPSVHRSLRWIGIFAQ